MDVGPTDRQTPTKWLLGEVCQYGFSNFFQIFYMKQHDILFKAS